MRTPPQDKNSPVAVEVTRPWSCPEKSATPDVVGYILVAGGGRNDTLSPVPVTYFNLLILLEKSRRQLRDVTLPGPGPSFLEWLKERQTAEHRAADAACEEFALSETWPPIHTESVVAQVHLRVRAAVDLCRAMVDRSLPAGLSRRQLLRGLLIEYWRARVAQLMGGPEPDFKALEDLKSRPVHLWSGNVAAGYNMTVAE